MTSGVILEARSLTKQFQGFVAVDNVDLKVRTGDIHAIIGPNGAGKTTLFNLLTKFIYPTGGTIHFKDSVITSEGPAQTARRGMVRSFQISAIFPEMTVLENVRAALQRRLKTSFHFWKSGRNLFELNDRATELLSQVGLSSHADRIASSLSYGQKRALELATTLAMDPELLLLDEPTQGMGHEDIETVISLIKAASVGRTVLMVEHNMKVISTIADRITVLQRGTVIADGNYDEVSADEQVVEAYLGTETSDLFSDVE